MIRIDSGLLNIGFDNYINKNKILAITTFDSTNSRKRRLIATEENKLIDATIGRKTKSIIHLYEGYVALSAVNPETLNERCKEAK